jgi:hypothetical protein
VVCAPSGGGARAGRISGVDESAISRAVAPLVGVDGLRPNRHLLLGAGPRGAEA